MAGRAAEEAWTQLAANTAGLLASGLPIDHALDQAIPQAPGRWQRTLEQARDALRARDVETAAALVAAADCFAARALAQVVRLAAVRPERGARLGHCLHATLAGRSDRNAARTARLRRTRTRAALVCLIVPVALGLLWAVEPSWFDPRSMGSAETWMRQASAAWLGLGALLFTLALRRPW